MTANQAEYSVQRMSRTLGVSRSGFYAYHSRPPSVRQVADERLSKRIAAIHEASKETYGAPRIHAELADEGIQVGRKRVERLMLANGLRGVSRRKFAVTTERDPRVRPAADLVDRNFYADAPNVLWVADITYVPTWAGFLYLAVVLDAFSRRVIAISNSEPLRRPLESAQYTSVAFGLRCKEMGIRPSMGSVGDCYDNAMCESFFATLECELLDRRKFKTKAEARVACFEFIEGWYNPSRRHSALGYKSPVNYERTAAEGLESPSP